MSAYCVTVWTIFEWQKTFCGSIRKDIRKPVNSLK